jgi:PncC family amidohydrolase
MGSQGCQQVTSDDQRQVALVVSGLRAAGRTLACAESLTGGRLASTIVDVPGASAVLRGGAFTYATDTKSTVLGVPMALLADRGPVDPEVAVAMAAGAASLFRADMGVATTGVAGPDPQDGVAVGTVFTAVVDTISGISIVRGASLSGDRTAIRQRTVDIALAMILEALDEPRPI